MGDVATVMRFGSRDPSEFFSQIRHRNAVTEIAWEDAVEGLGMAMSIFTAIDKIFGRFTPIG